MPPDGSVMPRKSFWSYIHRNRTDNQSISALRDKSTGELVTDTAGKANVLNQQFESVFTRETPLSEQHRAPQEYPGSCCAASITLLVFKHGLESCATHPRQKQYTWRK